MADSKFLKFQDKDGNNVNDVCPEIPYAQPKQCPPCQPNDSYIAPDWKIDTPTEPWLNEKECRYYVVVVTDKTSAVPYSGAADEEANTYITDLFEASAGEALNSLFETYDKKKSLTNIASATEALETSEYFLGVRYKSKVKLLYSIAYEDLHLLEDAEEDTEETSDSGITVTYVADNIYSNLQLLRKTLKMYANYYAIYGFADGGNLYFKDSGRLFSHSQLKRYGKKSYMMSILGTLDDFLNRNGYNIVTGLGDTFNFNDKVERIDITFSPEYVVEQMDIYTQGCDNVPIVFGPKKLQFLTNQEVYRDKTAMAYFSKLHKLTQIIQAREEVPWIDFLISHTYPALEESFNWPFEQATTGPSTANCVANALTNEGKQIGQDILSEGLSLAQAMIYQYSKDICETTHEERIENLKKLNLLYDPAKNDYKTYKTYAIEQAYKELEEEDVATQLCALLGIGSRISDKNPTNALYEMGLNDLKVCGLNNLLLEAIKCLVGGVSFEEFLAASTKAAIKGMNLENFGELFVGLPADTQQQIENVIAERLQSGDVLGDTGELIDLAVRDEIPHPWSDRSVIYNERKNPNQDPMAGPPETRTLSEKIMLQDTQAALNKNNVLGMYADALLEVYQDAMLDLVDELNKFPGAQIAIDVFTALDCPKPPVFDQTGFINRLNDRTFNTFAFCKDKREIKKPETQNPQEALINQKNWIGVFTDAAKLIWQRMLIVAITSSMKAVCRMVSKSACNTLSITGKYVGTLVTQGAATEIEDIIRDSLCGEGATGFQVQAALDTLFGSLGLGAEALADPESLDSFITDQSMSLSRRELLGGFAGEMSDEASTVIDNLIETEYPQYRDALPNKEAIKDFYTNMGNCFPSDVKAGIKDFLDQLPENDQMPAAPSLCATPEDLENYCNMRASLLEGRATAAQSRAMCDAERAERQQQIEDMAGLLNGLPELPPFVSDPGCENGLIPYENPVVTQAASAGLASEFKRLKIAYTKDMLGNGPFGDDWGMLNLVLSDTAGWPLTAHNRRTLYWRSRVDLITNTPDTGELFQDPPPSSAQNDAFPSTVAPWLRDRIGSLDVSFNATNDVAPSTDYVQSFEVMGITGSANLLVAQKNRLFFPEYGYNISVATYIDPTTESGSIILTENARKKTPDLTLEFRDSYQGKTIHAPDSYEGQFGIGYDISLFLSDIEEYSLSTQSDNEPLYSNVTTLGPNGTRIPADATRLVIDELTNSDADVKSGLTNYMDDDQKEGFWASLMKTFSVEQNQIFEFLSVDDTLEAILPIIDEYPNFAACFSELQTYSPQVVLLDEFLNKGGNSPGKDTLNLFRNNVINNFTNEMAAEIASNEESWSYGAQFESLTPTDAEYVLGNNTLSGWVKEGLFGSATYYDEIPGDTKYSDVRIQQEGEPEGEWRRLKNKDGIMGMSRDQYNNEVVNDNPENTRIFYLNPNNGHGGSFLRPRIYVKPLQNKGWVGMAEVMFPELSPCKPSRTDLVNFDELGDLVGAAYSSMTIDSRLQGEKDCVEEQPYNKILDRSAAAGIEGVIRAACSTYVSTHFLKASSVFTQFYPNFPQTYSNIYAQYIVENMEMSFKDAQNDFFEFFNHFKDQEFWYAFLEQSVQAYARLVAEGKIKTPPKSVKAALDRLSAVQKGFDFTQKHEFKEMKNDNLIDTFKTLRAFREEQTWEAVRASEEDAKIVLKEFVIMELNRLGEKFVNNLKPMGRQPKYSNLAYYILTNFSQGTSELDLHKEIQKTTTDLPETGADHYTAGEEFSVKSTGEPYVGYYHIHYNDEGERIYMEGGQHSSEKHEVILPLGEKIIVPIGDVAAYKEVSTYELHNLESPFIVEKYISINGTRTNPTTALNTVLSNPGDLNLSDVYPGTMKPVMSTDPVTGEQRQVGIKGKLGVRYGLLLSIGINGTKHEVTSVEIDALDLPISQFQPLSENTELLFCLINHLSEDDKFKLFYEYIFGVNKTLSLLAIYADLGFLPSIGEFTAPMGVRNDGFSSNKPGLRVSFPNASSGDYTPDYSNSVEGWYNWNDRDSSSLFVKTWDEWDKVLLGNTKARLKQMFKNYYFSRHWDPSFGWPTFNFGEWFLRNLKAAMFPSPARYLLPWWKRRRITSNPFDADGNECEKS